MTRRHKQFREHARLKASILRDVIETNLSKPTVRNFFKPRDETHDLLGNTHTLGIRIGQRKSSEDRNKTNARLAKVSLPVHFVDKESHNKLNYALGKGSARPDMWLRDLKPEKK